MADIGTKIYCGDFGGALAVLSGIYGNGAERVKKLTEDGYNADRVQECVNKLLKLIREYGGADYEN